LKKKLIKPIKILKKLVSSVRFRFYKQKTEKTESNRNKKPEKTESNWKTEPNQKIKLNKKNRAKTGKNRTKTEKTEPSRFELIFALKNRTGRFDPVSVWFGYFFDKTEPNRK
jgi:uncharacterized protein YcbK (DUF882 family)